MFHEYLVFLYHHSSGLLLLIRRTIIKFFDELPAPFGISNTESQNDFCSQFNEGIGRTILVARRSIDRVEGDENKTSSPIGCIAILSKNNKAAVLKVRF